MSHYESTPSEEDMEYEGAICINGICFRGNLFDKEQMDVVESLMISSEEETVFHYENKIKLLRSKQRKAIKKLKTVVDELQLKLNLCESKPGGKRNRV